MVCSLDQRQDSISPEERGTEVAGQGLGGQIICLFPLALFQTPTDKRSVQNCEPKGPEASGFLWDMKCTIYALPGNAIRI